LVASHQRFHRPVSAGLRARTIPLAASIVLLHCVAPNVAAAPEAVLDRDLLANLLARADQFLQVNEQEDGVTRDPRSTQNPAEEIRLSVVAQLLAYCELYRATGEPRYREDIVDRADFLIDCFDLITTGTAFDGMLGYALIFAYGLIGDPIYLQGAEEIRFLCLGLPPGALWLNAGLMCGMCLSEYFAQVQDMACLVKTEEIVESLRPYQHSDGSFPHVCPDSRDLHYTAWMSMELIIIAANIDLGTISQLLDGTSRFMSQRIDPHGEPTYKTLCEPGEECYEVFWSRGSGCPNDYDTRGWTNELAYHALVFDHVSPRSEAPVMTFLAGTASDGAYPDKWAYMPDPSDPIYVWASEQQSVIRTSVITWCLARMVADRMTTPEALICETGAEQRSRRMAMAATAAPSGSSASGPTATPGQGLYLVAPSPGRGITHLAYRLDAASHVRAEIFDITGRLVRVLTDAMLPAGVHEDRWDGTIDGSRRVPAGVYICRWHAGAHQEVRKIVRLD
jgi:hypothetical protein